MIRTLFSFSVVLLLVCASGCSSVTSVDENYKAVGTLAVKYRQPVPWVFPDPAAFPSKDVRQTWEWDPVTCIWSRPEDGKTLPVHTPPMTRPEWSHKQTWVWDARTAFWLRSDGVIREEDFARPKLPPEKTQTWPLGSEHGPGPEGRITETQIDGTGKPIGFSSFLPK